ncbi:MAG: GNAT family N-acetyltransferase [Pseudomonadota bacterium]
MIRFRNAARQEVGLMLDWAAAEGWNPGLDDAAAFYAADPNGFVVACENDEPVAAISVVNHNESYAFLGLYIARPSHRGKGIGYALWQHAVEHAGNRTIGLDGVPEQQGNYAASGFRHAGSTMRFSGRVEREVSKDIRVADQDSIAALIDREAEASGAQKPDYLNAWFGETVNRKTLIDRGGFLTIRKCREGAKIGPLVAADARSALRLIRHAATVFGDTVIIDIPDRCRALTQLCQELQLMPVFETARMYRSGRRAGTGEFYAVATLELG